MSKVIRSAAIIGSNWGLTYLRPLRERGIQPKLLVGQDPTQLAVIAKREGFSGYSTDVVDALDCDLVIVASPADSHSAILSQLDGPSLICEKPLLGTRSPQHSLPAHADQLWVNYAFPQLQTAQLAAQHLGELGTVSKVKLRSAVNLPLQFTLEQWILETSSHPLAWLLHQFGEPRLLKRRSYARQLELQFACGDTQLELSFSLSGFEGIYHHLELVGSNGSMQFSGYYYPGQAWQYRPVILNGRPVNQGEYSDSDCWLDANNRNVQLMIDQFEGRLSRVQARRQGLFDVERALWLDKLMTTPSPVSLT
ncbi:Gfo/Idh/MocA family oxidoreductase [Aliagarivorans taiwanensis]|uniref:Gfo/Idh/MocA family oxidoreductase n=1 Tax=Aliagarivorans taiwanensis TaxID=561966 RepID=UPI0003F4F9B0|nr:Gfo/Idh/MocA family oxidoreductase [Aliagarivorans taiwanensis]